MEMAGALVDPWDRLHSAHERGIFDEAEFDRVWDDAANRHGPVAAARAACDRAGIVKVGPCLHAGEAACHPWRTPWGAVQAFLLAAHKAADMRAVGTRRKGMAGLEGGYDETASLRLLRSKKLPPEHGGALRTAMMGGAFGNARAAHWGQRGAGCPWCQEQSETLWHRIWRCPKWEAPRLRALAAHSLSALRRRLPEVTLTTGILPAQHALVAELRAAEASSQWPTALDT